MTERGPEASASEIREAPRRIPSAERITTRLRRLDQQVRAFGELHRADMNDVAQLAESDVAQRIQTIARLHADELQLILDELADIAAELAGPEEAQAASPSDPAERSTKRAKWLAEQERRAAPVSRRDLLRGRGEDPRP